MTDSSKKTGELRNDIHDILEIQHIAQGRGQTRTNYEPKIIDAIQSLIDSAVKDYQNKLITNFEHDLIEARIDELKTAWGKNAPGDLGNGYMERRVKELSNTKEEADE